MKLLVSGSRSITDMAILEEAIAEYIKEPITEMHFGDARGVDQLAATYSFEHGIPSEEWVADWDEYEKSAGPIRNAQMVAATDTLLAIWDGESRGTKNCIDQAARAGKKVYIKYVVVK